MNNKHFKEKENPSAKIAFFTWDCHQYHLYKNIVKHLPEAEYVICDTWYQTIYDRGAAHIEEIIELLEKNKCHWRVMTELNAIPEIEFLLKKYEILAAFHMWPPLATLPWFFKKKTVRILDGCGKGLATFAPWSAYFDIALAYGPYTEEYLRPLNITYITGDQKFDEWFSKTINPEEIKRIKTKINPNKKTLLYLPTHSGLSSIYKFSQAIASLREKYNVLVKLHRLNKLIDSEAITPLLQKDILIFESKDDVLPLLSVSDIIVSDSSSAALETLLTDKPMIILDTSSNKEAWQKHQEGEEFNGFWYSGGIEYVESAGKKLRDLFLRFGLVAQNPDEIESALKNAFGASWDASLKERHQFRNYIFAHQDGTSGERAANIIREFLNKPKPTPPLLGAAIRAYFPNLEKNYKLGIQKMDGIIKLKNQRLSQYSKEAEVYRLIKNEKSLIGKISKVLKHFFKQ